MFMFSHFSQTMVLLLQRKHRSHTQEMILNQNHQYRAQTKQHIN
uniref:Uncharacterized protein n=1 Tax=Arundo donax TaxID=35708 RepID=A0A0A9B3C9_ARUDO